MHTTKKRWLALTQVNKLGVISFISSLSTAFVGTIWAIYLESILKNPSYVGFTLTGFTILAALAYIFLIPVIEKNSKTKIFLLAILAYMLSYICFAFFSSLWAIILIGAVLTIATTLRLTSFGIILRDKSKNTAVSRNISLVYTFFNLSWLIGPLVAGFVAEKYGIRSVFFIAAAFMALTIVLFKIFRIKDERTKKRIDKNALKVLKKFLWNRDRFLIYVISGGVVFWWTLIYIYIPIYIIESGLSDIIVGYFLSAVVIPLVLCEYYFGKKTAKIGFKKTFFIGYFFLGVLAITAFFMSNIYAVLGIIVFASIFMAMLEPTTEAYFFDIITKEQEDEFYGPYNTNADISNGLSLLLSAIVLLFLPFKFIFAFAGVCMFGYALLSLKVKNIVECKKKN